ncbi:hypothetical protein NKG60_17915 [Mesorhizobium sp. M1428]|uniref:hypothetical protein n=1 Tax=Mesorhizobium sp. M1428 TaxID=2957102 RepID=UPI00333B5124
MSLEEKTDAAVPLTGREPLLPLLGIIWKADRAKRVGDLQIRRVSLGRTHRRLSEGGGYTEAVFIHEYIATPINKREKGNAT